MSDPLWMQTKTGVKFKAYDPTPDMINVEDIAHSLAQQARFNGHLEEFYSNAQHSVVCSHLVDPGWELEALMHDAAEAYISDLPSPVKCRQPEYKRLENNIWAKAIAPKFGLNTPLHPRVKRADLLALMAEKEQLVTDYGYEWTLPSDLRAPDIEIVPLDWKASKQLFLNRFEELQND